MDQVQIPIEGNEASWRKRCYEKVERLNALQFPKPDPPSQQLTLLQKETFGKKNSVIFELRKVVQNGSVDNFVEVLEKVCWESKLDLSAIFDQVTPARDSLLHEAAYFGKSKIAQLIGHHFPKLLTSTNVDGDTPLHVAARSKRSSVIKVILSQCDAHAPRSSNSSIEDEKKITRLTNEYGNTALHEAVSSKHVEGVILLFEADKCVVHCLNKSNKSPLYLAVLTSDMNIVNVLLEAFLGDKPIPQCHGISPLHAAINARDSDLLMNIVEKGSDLMFLRDEDGGTPLHYAAAIGYTEGVHVLLKKSAQAALECNTKGHLPIHLATKWGHIEVLKELLQQEMDDSRVFLNKKGQNILHVAAKSGRRKVVKYILKNIKFKHLAVNKKDINGNTPLHLAASNPFIVFYLTQVKGIDLNIVNNEGLTARDMVWVKSEMQMTGEQSDNGIDSNILNNECLTARDIVLAKSEMQMTGEQEISNSMLKFAGAKESDKGIDLNIVNNKGLTARDMVREKSEMQMTGEQETANLILKFAGAKKSNKGRAMLRADKSHRLQATEDWMKDRMNILMVVAILIVTVTFAAGFTVPGGLHSSDDQNPRIRGLAVLGHKILFKMFVVLDTVAMYSSTFGSFLLLGAMIGKFKFLQAYGIALFMVGLALLLMTLAFMAAVSLVVSNIHWLAGLTICLGIVSFYFISSSSNAYMFFICFFGMRMYYVKSLTLLGFFKPSCNHQSLASEQAREED